MVAGAKLLLVGDQAQLSAVEACGAFGLLARRGTAHDLVSLWRFTHRWEAYATRRLRLGDPGALTDYDEHGRIHGGPHEAILEEAYAGWCADHRAGRTAILVAADNRTVATLNEKAHTDRRVDGTVAGPLVPLGAGGERGRAGVGDRILTRRNDRTVQLPGGGHVRNGALWTIAVVHPDGALTVTPAQHDGCSGGDLPAPPARVRLPTAYVAEHVDLGYAITAHRVQGTTVDAAHVLASPSMSREALYVAMTRGRDSNSVYVVTDSRDPACDHLPGEDVEHSPIQVLTAILADPRTEESATETRARSREESRSLHRLAPIRATIAADLDRRRWPGVLAGAGLNQVEVDEIVRSPASGALFAALRRGETLGHHMARVIAHLNPQDERRVEGLPRDLAAVLNHRVALWLAQAPDLTGHRPDPAEALHLLDTPSQGERPTGISRLPWTRWMS